MIKVLDLYVIFCSFILSEKYLIAKKYLNLQKCEPPEKSYVEDWGLIINNKKKVPYLVNLLEQP